MNRQQQLRRMSVVFADKAEEPNDDQGAVQRFEEVHAYATAKFLTDNDSLFDADRRAWSPVTARRADRITIEELIEAAK